MIYIQIALPFLLSARIYLGPAPRPAAVLSAFRTLGWRYRVASAFQFLMLASLVPPEFHSCSPRGRFLVLQSVVVWNAWVLVRPATVATVAAAAADTSCSWNVGCCALSSGW